MADKEERIYIGKSDEYTEPLYFNFFTKKQMQDKITDAIIKKMKEMGKGATPIFLAEAALNSLLEDKK